jgi:hypothetical protein
MRRHRAGCASTELCNALRSLAASCQGADSIGAKTTLSPDESREESDWQSICIGSRFNHQACGIVRRIVIGKSGPPKEPAKKTQTKPRVRTDFDFIPPCADIAQRCRVSDRGE